MTQSLGEHVAAQLRAEMARRRMSKAQLARMLDVDETWVGRRMLEKAAITMDDLQRIATALEVPLSYFLPESERVA